MHLINSYLTFSFFSFLLWQPHCNWVYIYWLRNFLELKMLRERCTSWTEIRNFSSSPKYAELGKHNKLFPSGLVYGIVVNRLGLGALWNFLVKFYLPKHCIGVPDHAMPSFTVTSHLLTSLPTVPNLSLHFMWQTDKYSVEQAPTKTALGGAIRGSQWRTKKKMIKYEYNIRSK